VPAGLSGLGLGTGFEDIAQVRRVRRVYRFPPLYRSCRHMLKSCRQNGAEVQKKIVEFVS
jgi:hypothetical protein